MTGTPKRVVLASGNAGKQREFRALLAPLGVEVLLQSDLGIEPCEETGATFEANALLKARHAAAAAHLPALADDSGLEVDALGGRPGVRSARYAGEGANDTQNNAKLLADLADVPEAGRTARYRCVIAFVRNSEDPVPQITHGSWEGRIAPSTRGSGGFGYDPLFVPQGQSITAAQMSAQDKNSVSHRAQALAHLLREFAAR